MQKELIEIIKDELIKNIANSTKEEQDIYNNDYVINSYYKGLRISSTKLLSLINSYDLKNNTTTLQQQKEQIKKIDFKKIEQLQNEQNKNILFNHLIDNIYRYMKRRHKSTINIDDYIKNLTNNENTDFIFYDNINELTEFINNCLDKYNYNSIYELIPTLDKKDYFNIYYYNQEEIIKFIINEILQ